MQYLTLIKASNRSALSSIRLQSNFELGLWPMVCPWPKVYI